MAIVPCFGISRVLLVALPDLNVGQKLVDQHNLLDCWAMLVGSEFDAPVPALGAWRQDFHNHARRFYQRIASTPVGHVTRNRGLRIDKVRLTILLVSQKYLDI